MHKDTTNLKKNIRSRQCISCRTQLPRDNFIRITKVVNPKEKTEEVVINPNKYQLGRSVYLCKNTSCINIAIKGRKIIKMLRVSNTSVKMGVKTSRGYVIPAKAGIQTRKLTNLDSPVKLENDILNLLAHSAKMEVSI